MRTVLILIILASRVSGAAIIRLPARARVGVLGAGAQPLGGRASALAMAAAPAAAAPLPNDTPRFRAARLRVFASLIVCYASYYLTRNSLTYVAPAMVAPVGGVPGLDITSVGLITSLFPLCYGASKFVAGVLGDRFDPRTLLASGLAVTALANIAFGASSTLSSFCALWCLNGLVQGCGAPSCAKILTSWFAAKERGTYWGLWNLSHNLGGFCAPILAGSAARALGWRAGFFAPGAVGISVSGAVLIFCRSTPEDLGFAPVEEPLRPATAPSAAAPPLLASLRLVSRDRRIWQLALSYLCVYVVRQGITSWAIFFLLDTGRAQHAGAAALRVTGLELGGLLGSLLAGRLSDVLVARARSGRVGMRVRVVIGYLVALALALAAFARAPVDSHALQWLLMGSIGAALYGPQMLVGLCGAELVGRGSVGASEGLLGLIAYVGAALAGLPLAALVKASRRVRAPPAALFSSASCSLAPTRAPAPLCPNPCLRAPRAEARLARLLPSPDHVRPPAATAPGRPGERARAL